MPRSQLKARRSAESKRDHTITATCQHTRTHNIMKKETARTHINGETQDVARKMNQLLPYERPRGRMESVTLRGLDVTCHFRLDQRENLAVDQCHDLSSKPAARGVEIGTHNHTVTATNQNTRTQTHSERNEGRSRPHTHL